MCQNRVGRRRLRNADEDVQDGVSPNEPERAPQRTALFGLLLEFTAPGDFLKRPAGTYR